MLCAVLCAVLSCLLSLSLPRSHGSLSSRARGGGRESTRERLVERVSAARASVARGRDGCNVIVARCGAGHPVVRACVRACVPARPRACPRIVVACPSCNPTLNFRSSPFPRFFSFPFPFSFVYFLYLPFPLTTYRFTPSFYPPTRCCYRFSLRVRACVRVRFVPPFPLAENFSKLSHTGLRARAPLFDVRFARRVRLHFLSAVRRSHSSPWCCPTRRTDRRPAIMRPVSR